MPQSNLSTSSSLNSRAKKRTPKPKNHTNSAKEFSEQIRGGYRSLPIKTRVLRQIAPQNSPKVRRNLCRKNSLGYLFSGVSQRPLTLILLQKYRDTNGRRIVIQIGGVHTTFCQEEGILLQKYRDRNGRCIAILVKSIGVRGRFDAPDFLSLKNIEVCQPRCQHPQ